jgi:cytochrome P450
MTLIEIPTIPADEPGAPFMDPALWADMDAWHARVAEIRRTQPVLPVEIAGFDPFWVLTRHGDIFEIERDDVHWPNTSLSILGPKALQEQSNRIGILPATLVHLDGEPHRKHRHVANDWFKPSAVARRQPRVDDIADEFVAKMRDLGGWCDFAVDIAAPYTLRVIMDIYGVPVADEPMMLELTQGMFGATDPEFMGDATDPLARATESMFRFVAYFNELTADRQACPRDDLASVIANGQIDGCPLGADERFWLYLIIATAGHDTTSFALSGGMEAMLRDPDQLWAVRDDPELVNNAAEEIIRWTSPVRHFLRTATDDSEVRGVPIPAGGRVLLSYPSANRDETEYGDAMTFDVRRNDLDRMLAFGVGPHFCLGAHFARREIRTMVGKLAQQLDHIEPAGEPQWSRSTFVSGVKHLPMAYTFR